MVCKTLIGDHCLGVFLVWPFHINVLYLTTSASREYIFSLSYAMPLLCTFSSYKLPWYLYSCFGFSTSDWFSFLLHVICIIIFAMNPSSFPFCAFITLFFNLHQSYHTTFILGMSLGIEVFSCWVRQSISTILFVFLLLFNYPSNTRSRKKLVSIQLR